MLRLALGISCALLLVFAADAAEPVKHKRKPKQHGAVAIGHVQQTSAQMAAAHRLSHRSHLVGVGFQAHVGLPPQILVDKPKLAIPGPVIRRKVGKRSYVCSADQASAVARDEGIRFQTLKRGKDVFTVRGFRNGVKAKIRISRKNGCAVLD